MTMSKTGERKWNELYQMRLYWLIIHHDIKNTSQGRFKDFNVLAMLFIYDVKIISIEIYYSY